MKVIVKITRSFTRQAKPLLKKFSSLKKELSQLEYALIDHPKLGKPLGHDSFKIRIAVQSKGKGKSGGLRVISHIDTEVIGVIEEIEEVTYVNLIAIFDKSDTGTISEKELIDLINRISE